MKIAAVVVTYNRLNYLKQCISALKNQSYTLNEIIVINNSSTDGTLTWLETQKDIFYITQMNLGGAGGFNTGIKIAFEKGFDWIWCMDDDGYPERNCLEILIKNTKGNENIVAGPLIIDRDNFDQLAFRIPVASNNKDEKSYTYDMDIVKIFYKDSLIEDWVAVFNGTLFPRKIIGEIGYPLKELFIWGDEFEYIRRVRKNNLFKIFSIPSAEFFHPKFKMKMDKFLFNKEIFCDVEINQKYFYLFRNLGYLSKEDYRFYNIKYVVAQFVHFIMPPQLSFRKAVFFLKSYVRGMFSEFSN